MKSPGFNPEKDLAPMPFDDDICQRALEMKESGLTWQPHVGCFVWDPDELITPASPFPGRIYFILSLQRFIEIFDSSEQIAAKLVWLPTWHQARLLCRQLGISDQAIDAQGNADHDLSPGEDLLHVYGLIAEALKKGNKLTLTSHPENTLEKLCRNAIEQRLGNVSGLPEDLVSHVFTVYRQFVESYLNILRQSENKTADWMPETLSIDHELVNGMRHFFSDYQHITRKFYSLNQKIESLQEIDKDSQPNLYRNTIDDILRYCHQSDETAEESGNVR